MEKETDMSIKTACTSLKISYTEYKDEGSLMGYRNNILHFLWLYFITDLYRHNR